MKVILAQSAGFCKGVRRAMNLVLEESGQSSGPIYTDGPLIHNPQTIEVLESRGVKVLGKEETRGPGETIFIRTHGITPERRQALKDLGVTLCDATCPDVAKIQGLIRRNRRADYDIIIVGDRDHAEVIGLAGYAGDRGHVVSRPEEVAGLPPADKVCVVAQSTLEPAVFQHVAEAVRARYGEVLVLDTICPSTRRRQEELRELAHSAEAIVVVGGKNSANTRRLAQISQAIGTPTFLVETAAELDESKLKQFRNVAVTAGASTPNWIIMEAVDRLKAIEPEGRSPVLRGLKQIGLFVVKSNLYVAFSSLMLCYANARLMAVSLGRLPYFIAFFYILGVHLLNHLTDQGALRPEGSRRLSNFRKKEKFFVWLTGVSALTALVLAGLKGWLALGIMLVLTVLGLLYRIDLPEFRLTFRGKRLSLRLIPASKDIFMALGWSFVTVLLPVLVKGHLLISPAVLLTFAATFLLVTIRSLFFDIRDIQGDRIVGRETLPTIIGTRGSMILILTLTSLYTILMLSGALFGWITASGYAMLALSLYISSYLYLYHQRIIHSETLVEVVGDTQFILAGVLAFLSG